LNNKKISEKFQYETITCIYFDMTMRINISAYKIVKWKNYSGLFLKEKNDKKDKRKRSKIRKIFVNIDINYLRKVYI